MDKEESDQGRRHTKDQFGGIAGPPDNAAQQEVTNRAAPDGRDGPDHHESHDVHAVTRGRQRPADRKHDVAEIHHGQDAGTEGFVGGHRMGLGF